MSDPGFWGRSVSALMSPCYSPANHVPLCKQTVVICLEKNSMRISETRGMNRALKNDLYH